MSYRKNFSNIYDFVYSSKDYKRECDFILSLVGENKKILDVGCGTGTHAAIISEKSNFVHGIDISEDMINVAKNKYLALENIDFIKSSVEAYLSKTKIKYDAVICMFNIVNHINKLEDLMVFINTCSRLLKSDGYIIFDCWNSVACAIEKPWKNSSDHKVINDEICKISTTTEVSSMASNANMHIVVECPSEVVDLKLNNLALWSPRLYAEILTLNNIYLESIINMKDFSKGATETNHRILFVGRNRR